MIESSNNQQIKYVLHLKKNSRFRKKEKAFLVEGWKMVAEALSHGLVKSLFLSEEQETEAKRRLMSSQVEPCIVSKKVFLQISDTMSPQGVLAVVSMPEYSLEDYLTNENISFLCLEDINDPGNLGTMMRTAEGAGMTGVIMSKGTVDIFNPKVVRSTMGSLFRVPFFYIEDFVKTMQLLSDSGFELYAAHLKGDMSYQEAGYTGKVGIMIGNEANGLTEEVTAFASHKVLIPMSGELESLNAAVSAALLMYEVRRNRK